MFNGRFKKYRQSEISSTLTFTGTADYYVIISVSPILGKPFIESVNTLGNNKKVQISAPFYNLPYISVTLYLIFGKNNATDSFPVAVHQL